MYLSIAAILGTFLRIAMAQLFGDECANPGTVGWLAASSPLCVTKDGDSEREGGIVFAVSEYMKCIGYNIVLKPRPFHLHSLSVHDRIFRPIYWVPS